MKKESVKKFDLEAAFKALDEIEVPQTKGIKANRVDLKERFGHKPATEALVEDYYDVSSAEDLNDAKEERDGEIAKAKLARIEKIVDLNAESPEDLLPSYVGKVIMQCPQCMTLFYKNPEDIEPSEENPDIVNLNEPCQHCGNTSGYTLIGKVGAVTEDEADKYEEAPAEENKNELNLDFGKGTEEVDADGTGEGAKEMSDEEAKEESADETSSDKDLDLDLNLDEVPEEEPEEKKKEESLKESKVKDNTGDDATAPTIYHLFLDGKEVYESESIPLKQALSEITTYIKKLTPEQKRSFSLSWEFDESGYYDKPMYDNEGNIVGSRNDWEEIQGDTVVGVFSEAECKEYGYAFPEDRFVVNVDYAGDAIRKALDADVTANLKEESLKESKATKQRLTVVEPGYQYKDKNGNLYTLYGDELEEDDTGITYDWEFVNDENGDIYIREEMAKLEKPALKESVESEIDSIIASWGVNEGLIKEDKSLPLRSIEVKDKENSRKGIGWQVFYGGKNNLHKEFKNEEEAKKFAKENNGKLMPIRTTEVESLNLTEEGDLDRLLDSDEFKTPVSEEEINAARREVAKESLKEEKEDESMAPTIYNLFLDDKLVYESESIPLNKALSEITAYIKKLTPEQKRSFSLSWEFDESGYYNKPMYDNEGNIVGSRNDWEEIQGDVVVGVFSEAECKEYGCAFPEERLVVNVDYAGEAIRKALGADIEDREFNEDDIDELDEGSLNKHIDEYLKEVYSNVKSYETTDCELKEGKLIVEGKISFNSGKEKLTMFEFLPAYCEGKLFFEGYNKDFSEDKAFKLNCSIDKSKTLITESFGYKYKINENLVEGLK